MRAADVVVVGGGLIGCAVAFELARRGARAVVLERGAVGGEASGAAAGMVAPQAECERPGPLLALGLLSRRRYPGWVEQIEAASGIDVEYRRGGIVYVALTAADVRTLAARRAWQRREGMRVARLGAAAARRLVPEIGPLARMALHFPNDHRVNNERLALAVAAAARSAGAEVREHVAAVAVRAHGDAIEAVESTAGTIPTRVVVNAAGAWGGGLGLPVGVTPPPVVPIRGQMLVLRGPAGMLSRPVYSLRGYVVPRVDGRVLAGSTLEDVGFDKRVTAGAAAAILSAACAMVPALALCTLERTYAGFRPKAPDGLPVLGAAPELRGLVHATGHYRSGILLAPATAAAIADLVEHGRTRWPIAAMGPARFAEPGARP